jgi:hypothetical protein
VRPLGRKRRRWVDNIKLHHRGIAQGGVDWIALAHDRKMESSCERGNERSGSIKCRETVEWLYNW